MKSKIYLDLTPWIRGPSTSLGLCAYFTTKALLEVESSAIEFVPVSRVPTTENPFPKKIEVLSKFSLAFLLGKGSVFHSFEHKTPISLRGKTSMTLHDIWTLNEKNTFQNPKFQATQAPKLRNAILRADGLVTPCDHVRSQVLKMFPKQKLFAKTIPWGPMFNPSDLEGSTSKSRPYFLMVGAFEKRKNHSLVLKACERLEGFDLVFAGIPGFGSDEILKELEAFKIRKRGKINVDVFQNLNRASLTDLYADARALILPSFDEGFGLPVIEAMQFSKPLLLSDIPTLREVAEDAALYFSPEPKGATNLSHLILKCLEDNEFFFSQSQKSFERAPNFNWNRTRDAYVSFFKELLAKK